MPRTCLGWSDVVELIELLTDVFSYISSRRDQNPLAKWIQFSKIPPILSESLCVLEAEKLFPGSSSAVFGGRECDVVVNFGDETRKTAEIKATGQSAFQALSNKDIAADFLVWVHFGRFFEDNNEEIRAYVVDSPGRIFTRPVKINLERFRSITRASIREVLLGDE